MHAVIRMLCKPPVLATPLVHRFTSVRSAVPARAFATGNAAGPKPFRVLGIQQIAIGGPSKAALGSLWVDLFGCTKTSSFRSERENVDEDILTLGKGAYAVEIDLMEPINPEKVCTLACKHTCMHACAISCPPCSQSPRVDSPPLNHIGLWVDDLDKAVAWMTASGVRFTPGGIRKGAAGYNVVFIHPKVCVFDCHARAPGCGSTPVLRCWAGLLTAWP